MNIKFKTDEGLTPFEESVVPKENGFYEGVLEKETKATYIVDLPVIGTVSIRKSDCYDVLIDEECEMDIN